MKFKLFILVLSVFFSPDAFAIVTRPKNFLFILSDEIDQFQQLIGTNEMGGLRNIYATEQPINPA